MKLLRFEAENIFSLGHVEVDLENKGLILITGYSEDEGSSNGAGKSSLTTKGILWALFGQIPEDVRADDVVNRHGKKGGWAHLKFIGNDGNLYSIDRKRNPNQLKLAIHAYNPGTKESGDLTRRNQKETQELINQAIGRDFDTFIQSDFFGQGREMSYASLTPKQQKEILEQILPMEACDRWAEYAKQCFKGVEELVGKAERELHSTSVKLTTLRMQEQDIKARYGCWEKEKGLTLDRLREQLAKEEDRTVVARENLEELHRQLENVQASIMSEEDNRALLVRQEKLDELIKSRKEQEGEANRSLVSWKQTGSQCERDIAILETRLVDKICPRCEQPISEEKIQKALEEREILMNSLAEAKRNIEAANEAYVYWGDELVRVVVEQQGIDKLKELQFSLRKDRLEIEEKITHLKQEIGSQADILRAKIEDKSKETNPHTSQLQTLSGELSKLAEEEKDHKKGVKKLEREREDLLYWHNVYGKDLKLKLFEAACPFLDARAAYHLTALGNDQIHVEFSTVKRLATGEPKEEFCVRAWSDTGGASFGSLSGGEKKMTSFAIGLALADLASSQATGTTDFLILDEPFEQLDERNSESIVNYLQGVCDKSTILLVSNEAHLKQLLPNRIHVVKRKGVSNIEGKVI
jgi:DNA repair exonuclease SbcCD ATPase subunit